MRNTALALLRHMGMDFSRNGSGETNGFLLDMSRMWELYLEGLFRRRQPEGIQILAQEDGSYYPIYPVLSDMEPKTGRRQFKPDFLWKDGEDTPLIADAKYKSSWSDILEWELVKGKDRETLEKEKRKEYKGLSEWKPWRRPAVREDVFQVLAYMYTLNCSRGLIICPVRADKCHYSGEPLQYAVSTQREADRFCLLGLSIPSAESYDDFLKEMKKSEDNFLDQISTLRVSIKGPQDLRISL